MTKPAQLLLVHGPQYSGNRPQVIHHHGAGIAMDIQRHSVAKYAEIHLFPCLQGHGFNGFAKFLIHAAGNLCVACTTTQPS